MSDMDQANPFNNSVPDAFALKDKLGETPSGETWMCFDRTKKRRLVLKRYKRSYFQGLFSEEDMSRFLDVFPADCAAWEMPEIKEPNTFLKVVQYGIDDEFIWFARESAGDEQSILRWRSTGKPPRTNEVLKRFMVYSATLIDLHGQGLVHGNLHPGNLFLSGVSSAMITDPDIGRLHDPATYGTPIPAEIYGNPDFLSPEQRPGGNGNVDAKTDVWGLAASLAYAFIAKKPGEFEIEQLPEEFRNIVAKSMQDDPAQRFGSMKEFRAVLGRLHKDAKPVASSFEDALEPDPVSPKTTEKPTPPAASAPYQVSPPAQQQPGPAKVESREPKCPQCGTPVAPNSKICPKCHRGYDEPCLNCQALNPFWLTHCRGCNGDIRALKQQTAERLHTQQQQIIKLREIYAHEKAQVLVKMMSQVTHPDFHAYREWAKNLLPAIQKERRDIRNYVEGVRAQAKAAMDSQKYEQVQKIIEQVPPTLLDEEFRAMHAEAGECITEVDSLIREIRNAIVTKKYNTLLSTVQRYAELKANDPEAKALQEKIEKLTTVTAVNGSKFRRIPPGKFYMGSHESDVFIRNNERPQHRVTITKPFFMGVYPVTQDEFNQLMEFNPSISADDPRCPVDNVTWFTAIEYCNKLSEQENLPPYYEINVTKRRSNGLIDRADVTVLGGEGYRLPSEAEWEYCCRAGSITPWYFGDQVLEVMQYAWYFDNSQNESHPVGEKKPNAWGLYDMHGNLLEWCYDWYGEFYYQQCIDIEDPIGPDNGSSHVLRGGAWQFGAEATRSPYRNNNSPESSSSVVGFRIMRNAPEEAPPDAKPQE